MQLVHKVAVAVARTLFNHANKICTDLPDMEKEHVAKALQNNWLPRRLVRSLHHSHYCLNRAHPQTQQPSSTLPIVRDYLQDLGSTQNLYLFLAILHSETDIGQVEGPNTIY